MSPNWPKLASLAQTTSHFNCFKFCECVYCSQGHSSQNLLTHIEAFLYGHENVCRVNLLEAPGTEFIKVNIRLF